MDKTGIKGGKVVAEYVKLPRWPPRGHVTDAVVVQRALHLMYSPGCNKNWAEFDNYPSGYRFALVGWSHNDKGTIDIQPEYWTSNGDEVAWTDVDGTYPAGVGVCETRVAGRS